MSRSSGGDAEPAGDLRVANAPVSYGAFEATVGGGADVPGADDLLAAIASAGYEGSELGPPGYLGAGAELRARLERHGLELAGGYIPIRFSEPEAWETDREALRASLDLLAAAGTRSTRAVLADAGSPARRAALGRAARDRSVGLDDGGWRRFADGVARAAASCRERGLEPTFHHHAGTYVEAPWEIERLLELTDVPLLLDTGHLHVGGGDARQAVSDWGGRVNHVHVKDVRAGVLAAVVRERADMLDAWRRGLFCELGTGDVPLVEFFARLRESPYRGWIVVEQDRILRPGEELAEAAEAQARNRAWLREVTGV